MKANVRNSEGFSLIEMMIALVIMALTLLALSAVMIHAIQVNIGNDLRNMAIRLSGQTAELMFALPFDSLRSCGVAADPTAPFFDDSYRYDAANSCLINTPNGYQNYPNPVQTIKGFKQKFNVTWDVLDLNEIAKQITINVSYRERNEYHVHSAVLYRHRTP